MRAWVNSFPRLPRPRMWIEVVVVEEDIFEEVEKGRDVGEGVVTCAISAPMNDIG